MQHTGLDIYLFSALECVEDGEEDETAAFPGALEDNHLVIECGQEDVAWRMIVDAANSADPDPPSGDADCDRMDREIRDALTALASRVIRLPRAAAIA